MRLVRDIFQTLYGKDRSSMASPGMSYPLVFKLLSYTRLLEEWNKSFAVLSKLMSIVSWVSSTPRVVIENQVRALTVAHQTNQPVSNQPVHGVGLAKEI